jgi:hypothetical protein
MKIKAVFCVLILATLASVSAKADEVTITIDQPSQTASAGATLQFFGTITNDTDSTLYLNSDDLTLPGLSLTTTDQFFNTVPNALAPDGSSGDIELFDVTVSNPLLDPAGTYSGTYNLTGGPDGNAQDNLGTATFSVTTVTPEPPSLYLLLTGILSLAALAWKGGRNSIEDGAFFKGGIDIRKRGGGAKAPGSSGVNEPIAINS